MKKNEKGEVTGFRTPAQSENDSKFKDLALSLIEQSGDNWAMHALAVLKRNSIARILYLEHIYKKAIDVPGVICEFGVHWGAGMSTLVNLRSLLEPYNHARHIYGFDTFDGFAGVTEKDGKKSKKGDYATHDEFEFRLAEILRYHESIAPFPHQEKFSLIKGDVIKTVPKWLKHNPHALISMAIFDMDIYKPTKEILPLVIERMPKGALLVFDELNCSFFPGETEAIREVLGVKNLRLQKHPLQPYCAFCEIE